MPISVKQMEPDGLTGREWRSNQRVKARILDGRRVTKQPSTFRMLACVMKDGSRVKEQKVAGKWWIAITREKKEKKKSTPEDWRSQTWWQKLGKALVDTVWETYEVVVVVKRENSGFGKWELKLGLVHHFSVTLSHHCTFISPHLHVSHHDRWELLSGMRETLFFSLLTCLVETESNLIRM